MHIVDILKYFSLLALNSEIVTNSKAKESVHFTNNIFKCFPSFAFLLTFNL